MTNYKVFITEKSNITTFRGGTTIGKATFDILDYQNFHAIDVPTSVVNIDQKLLKDETVMQNLKLTSDNVNTQRLKEYLHNKGFSKDLREKTFSFNRDLFSIIIYTGSHFVVYGTRNGLKPFHGKHWGCYFCGIEDYWSDIYTNTDTYTNTELDIFNKLKKLLELPTEHKPKKGPKL